MLVHRPAPLTNVLFLDLDGTLVTNKDRRQYVPPSAIDALVEARRRGALAYLCTGRSLAEARTVGDLPVDGIIGAAGGFVLDGETMVSHRLLLRAEVESIESYLRSRGITYYLESNSGLYFDEEYLRYVREAWDIDDDPAWESIAMHLDEADRDYVNKVSFYTASGISFEEVEAALGNRFYLVRSSSGDPSVTSGEISIKGVNKATAIDQLLEHLALPRVRTFGFGDSMNDVEMLQRCDEAIVMGDARHSEVKQYATYVTTGVLEDGIAQAMRHFRLID